MILTACRQSALTGCNVTAEIPDEIKPSAKSHDGFVIAISRCGGRARLAA
jgi:hypothetical protein